MRAAVLILILVNVVLFAYARLDAAAQSEGGRLHDQVAPERIKLVSPKDVAALTPAKLVCVEWGPFGDADREKAQGELEPLAQGSLVSQRTLPPDTTYWVNLGAMPTRAAAEQRAGELRAQSVTDLSVVDYPRGQFTVSLGVFRTETAANARAQTFIARGVTGTHVEPRAAGNAQSMIFVRDAPESLVARIRQLSAQFAGTDVKAASCAAS